MLAGELLWDQHCHRHDDIATAIRLSEEFGYRLVVNHGTEAHKIADVLAEKQIPVIFGPLLTSRSKVELRDRAIGNLALIAAAGVKVADHDRPPRGADRPDPAAGDPRGARRPARRRPPWRP